MGGQGSLSNPAARRCNHRFVDGTYCGQSAPEDLSAECASGHGPNEWRAARITTSSGPGAVVEGLPPLEAPLSPAEIVQAAAFETRGPSPLDYSSSTWLPPQRAVLVDPAAGEPPPGESYFAETTRKVRLGKNGRRLKTPRTEVTPGAGEGVVAFVDYSLPSPETLYIAFATTRRDFRGNGAATRIVCELVAAHPECRFIDFGRVITEAMDAVRQRVAERFPERSIRYKKMF